MSDARALPSYPLPADRFDELVDSGGRARPAWSGLGRAMDQLGLDELGRRKEHADRILRGEGSNHLVHDDEADIDLAWEIDPIPLPLLAAEWKLLEAGLTQRAEVLEAILEDVYGDRRLLRGGVVPPTLVLSAAGYVRRAVGLPVAGKRLVVHGADVVRTAAGGFVVLRDLAELASGAGSALLNRRVLTRVFPEVHRSLRVEALDAYFTSLRAGLATLAPPTRVNPRSAVLTSGFADPGYVEHSYLALQLGYTLVEAADLTVRGRHLWLRSLHGLEPIDVVLRFIPDRDIDPLEIDGGAPGGVAGLLDTCRAGNVGLANAMGSGLAGHLALLAFLPDLCRHLLGEELELPSVPTYWCGSPDHRARVLDGIDGLLVHDLAAASDDPIIGSVLSDDAFQRLRAEILAHPERFVAQELVDMATTPIYAPSGVRPGSVVLRTQSIAVGDRRVVLPGADARVVDSVACPRASHVGKDVWVLADPAHDVRRRATPALDVPQIDLRGSLPSRVGEALLWAGRNAERAETVARVVQSVLSRWEQRPELAELGDGAWARQTVAALRAVSGGFDDGRPGRGSSTGGGYDFWGHGTTANVGSDVSADLLAAISGRAGSLTDSISHLLTTTRSTREWLSTTTWRLLAGLEVDRDALLPDATGGDPLRIADSIDRLLITLAAFAGLSMESLVRGPGWRFLDLGRRLERALLTLGITEAMLTDDTDPLAAPVVLETALASCESLVAYRRRHRSDVTLDAACDLVLADDANPRSLAFQLDRLGEDLASLDVGGRAREARAHVDQARSLVLGELWRRRGRGPEQGSPLTAFVLDVREHLLALDRSVVATWFIHADPMRRGGA